MRINEWEARYRSGERPAEDLLAAPTPLVVATASKLAPGAALDVASGTGRNALWLAEQGWRVTAVDGSPSAIDILKQRVRERDVEIDARVADLESPEFSIEPDRYDLVCKCYYMQRGLFPAVRAGVRAGGIVIVIVHLVRPGEEVTYKRATPGELRGFFADWDVLHYFEGRPNDPTHKRPVAEIVARKRG